MTLATLTAQGLAKSYKGRKVVKNVSLRVSAGQIVGLLGPNGAGKTTSFYMIVGLVPNDSGNIVLNDEDLTMYPMHERARRGIGYLPQEASIFRKLSVYDNIMSILQTRKELSEVDREEKLEHLLEEFNIGHIKDNLGMSLSGGERRRVEIARALAADPKFILLDEPTSALDRSVQLTVIDLLKDIQKKHNIGFLFISHDLSVVKALSDRVLVMQKGEVMEEGTADEIFHSPKNDYTKMLIDASFDLDEEIVAA